MKPNNALFLEYLFVSRDLLYDTGLGACLADTYRSFWKENISEHKNLSEAQQKSRTHEMHVAVIDFLAYLCERNQVDEAAEVNTLYKKNLLIRGKFLSDAHETIMILRMKQITTIYSDISHAYSAL